YKGYARVPNGAWREMHEHYLFAEERGIATGAADVDSAASITDFYCMSLLLSLTDPYRLVSGEIDPIEALIWELRAPVALGREPPVTRATSHFLVGAGDDAPPNPLPEPRHDELGEGASRRGGGRGQGVARGNPRAAARAAGGRDRASHTHPRVGRHQPERRGSAGAAQRFHGLSDHGRRDRWNPRPRKGPVDHRRDAL